MLPTCFPQLPIPTPLHTYDRSPFKRVWEDPDNDDRVDACLERQIMMTSLMRGPPPLTPAHPAVPVNKTKGSVLAVLIPTPTCNEGNEQSARVAHLCTISPVFVSSIARPAPLHNDPRTLPSPPSRRSCSPLTAPSLLICIERKAD